MTPSWIHNAVFYHIYPLGLLGAPRRNDFTAAPTNRLERLFPWIDHLLELGANALYLGPVFESSAHGYDTVDYFQVDRRLGDIETLKRVARYLKARGGRLVLDAVLNHVGRDFWAFRDVQQHGQASRYCDWFHHLDFTRRSPYGDAFSYEGWAGHYDLVKLNTSHPDVRRHLLDAVSFWVETFDVDGLRLDAADHLEAGFMRALASHCRALKPDFWLMGEVVHGDYRRWANPEMLDATTNYECYKGLYSSHVDKNYFEIAYSLKRQFGEGGLYPDLMLYNFADNHDVNRVASSVKRSAHLYPLYGLLFTMPGVPSIYYGSEWGLTGRRTDSSDSELRPCLDLEGNPSAIPQPDLKHALQRFAALRHDLPALRYGNYRELLVASEQLAFCRACEGQTVVVAVNAADQPAEVRLAGLNGSRLHDRLNACDSFQVNQGTTAIEVPPAWLRVMVLEG
jgi:glycosidase